MVGARWAQGAREGNEVRRRLARTHLRVGLDEFLRQLCTGLRVEPVLGPLVVAFCELALQHAAHRSPVELDLVEDALARDALCNHAIEDVQPCAQREHAACPLEAHLGAREVLRELKDGIARDGAGLDEAEAVAARVVPQAGVLLGDDDVDAEDVALPA